LPAPRAEPFFILNRTSFIEEAFEIVRDTRNTSESSADDNRTLGQYYGLVRDTLSILRRRNAGNIPLTINNVA
jgi:hypothetical protein